MSDQFTGRRFPLTDGTHHQDTITNSSNTMATSATPAQSHPQTGGHEAATASGARGNQLDVSDLSDESGADGSDSDGSDDHVVTKPPPKKKKTTKEKVAAARANTAGHFKKHWLWYLIGFIIFLAILLPIL